MTKRIAMFNHKGGVSKTTTTFHLAWMLAEKGKRVLMVDTDPQCNLTGLVLGQDNFEDFYKNSKQNIKDNLAPAFKGQPKVIKPVECIEIEGRKGLFLLPGHIGLAEYEITLGIAQELSGSIHTLQNIPGAFSYLLQQTADKYDIEYIFIDMNPGLGSINQNLLMTSDYFIIPTSPDYFSIMALESLIRILPLWRKWSDKAMSLEVLTGEDTVYPFPIVEPKLLGIVVQRYTVRSGEAASNFRKWIDNIYETIQTRFAPELDKIGMTIRKHIYKSSNFGSPYCLAEIPDFASLAAISQNNKIPTFALTDEQLIQAGQQGLLKDNQRERINTFRNIFSSFADEVVRLTNDEYSN